MLTDPTQSEAFRRSRHWDSPLLEFQLRVEQERGPGALTGRGGPAYRSHSFSGNERNRLVLATANGFVDRSLVSGVDCKEDARSFAVLDYDADGWLDIALASANAPRLRLFRNRAGDMGGSGRTVTVRLIGGNHDAAASGTSNRDACAALLMAFTTEGKRLYRRSIGEGLSSQNSSLLRITLRDGESLERVVVKWPSGRSSEKAIAPGLQHLEISE